MQRVFLLGTSIIWKVIYFFQILISKQIMRVEIASTLSVIRGRNRIFSGRHDALTQVLTRDGEGKDLLIEVIVMK